MSRILYIGDYYPNFSYKAKLNQYLVERIRSMGHEVFLLSSAWCKVDKDNFWGSVEELAEKKPFQKKYFIDPIQVKYSKLEMSNAYLGLGCKIIENEHIEQIVFADDFMYVHAVALFKSIYKISCVYLSFDCNAFQCAMNDYVWPYMQAVVNDFDKIITYSNYAEMWEKVFKVDKNKIYCSVPIECEVSSTIDVYGDKLFLLCENNSKKFLLRVLRGIKSKVGNIKRSIVIISPTSDISEDVKIGKAKYKKIFAKNLVKGSMIIKENELIDDSPLDISYVLTMLSCELIPLVSERHLKLLKEYEVCYQKIGELYAICSLKMNSKKIEDFFVINKEEK